MAKKLYHSNAPKTALSLPTESNIDKERQLWNNSIYSISGYPEMIVALDPNCIREEDLDFTSFVVYKKETDCICWGGGLLSLKMTFSGKTIYKMENGLFSVDESTYLIL